MEIIMRPLEESWGEGKRAASAAALAQAGSCVLSRPSGVGGRLRAPRGDGSSSAADVVANVRVRCTTRKVRNGKGWAGLLATGGRRKAGLQEVPWGSLGRCGGYREATWRPAGKMDVEQERTTAQQSRAGGTGGEKWEGAPRQLEGGGDREGVVTAGTKLVDGLEDSRNPRPAAARPSPGKGQQLQWGPT
ncbi:hypothetical protein CMUS01_13098 [Colletotrichum musicola]|uniref:Uncharacterized protein n=1 Tax=Colletotrichum musicola TaxID=2175873 RepID=A0A8H6MX45_9PEZI|nr:hypothetical protein CMUS01_13098 [Colletotrichum musicola]